MVTLSQLIPRYINRCHTIAAASAEDVSHEMIDRTPVLSGSMVSSMTGTVNGSGVRNVTYPVPPEIVGAAGMWNNPRAGTFKSQAKARATRAARRMRVGDSYTFVSSKPYSRRVEYEEWSYMKAPAGMRGIAVAQWRRIVNQNVRRYRGI